jgi:hypothetical protein
MLNSVISAGPVRKPHHVEEALGVLLAERDARSDHDVFVLGGSEMLAQLEECPFALADEVAVLLAPAFTGRIEESNLLSPRSNLGILTIDLLGIGRNAENGDERIADERPGTTHDHDVRHHHVDPGLRSVVVEKAALLPGNCQRRILLARRRLHRGLGLHRISSWRGSPPFGAASHNLAAVAGAGGLAVACPQKDSLTRGVNATRMRAVIAERAAIRRLPRPRGRAIFSG